MVHLESAWQLSQLNRALPHHAEANRDGGGLVLGEAARDGTAFFETIASPFRCSLRIRSDVRRSDASRRGLLVHCSWRSSVRMFDVNRHGRQLSLPSVPRRSQPIARMRRSSRNSMAAALSLNKPILRYDWSGPRNEIPSNRHLATSSQERRDSRDHPLHRVRADLVRQGPSHPRLRRPFFATAMQTSRMPHISFIETDPGLISKPWFSRQPTLKEDSCRSLSDFVWLR